MRTVHTTQNIFDLYMGPQTIFDLAEGSHAAVCITTNGIVKQNGHAVMGAGIAKEANQRFSCSKKLGELLTKYGNHVYDLGEMQGMGGTFHLISFPTKHHWKDKSDITLIRQSATELSALCDKLNIQTCYLTPPGCGCGRLNWDYDVEPVLKSLLDDCFTIVFRHN